jgi:hypothetical protein
MHPIIKSMSGFKWTRASMFIFLAAIYLLTHLPLLNYVPLMRDEGLYSIMIEEQISHPTFAPTFLGYQVPWKPIGLYWVYAPFSALLGGISFLPIESVYRLPGFLFGLINVFLVFFIFKKLSEDEYEAFLATLIYSSVFLITNIDSRVMTDTLCATGMLAGILAYLNGPTDRRCFALGGLMVFITYFIKQVNAASILVVAAAYLFEKDKKRLLDPVFLISLAAFPAAMLLFNASIADIAPVSDTSYFIQLVLLKNLNLLSMGASLYALILMAGVWAVFSLFGFWKNWRKIPALSAWYGLIVFPLFTGVLMPWYFYPVIAPIAYFSLQFLKKGPDGKERMDDFFYIVLALLAMTGFIMGMVSQVNDYGNVAWAKRTGEFLAGKENVLIIGLYEPTVPSYKMLEEIRGSGKPLDMGWISLTVDRSVQAEEFYPFLKDYHLKSQNVTDGTFADLFWRTSIFRKDTNITRFDYICVIGNESVYPGGKLVLNATPGLVYDMRD